LSVPSSKEKIMTIAPLLLLLAAPLFQLSDADLGAYLSKQAELAAPFETRLTQVAQDSLGTPYAGDGPLGEGATGKYDTDPLMDHRRADCVTFIEQSIAFATASGYEDALARLQKIRYRQGKIDYESRNHFMVSDWARWNTWCHDITIPVPVDQVTRTISRAAFFRLVKAPELGQDTPDENVTLSYIPTTQAAAAEKVLPSPSIILFIGKKPDWLFSLHTGLYLEGKLYHASSLAKKVVAVDLSDYVASQAERYLGFAAYQITEPSKK
jgi:hypothetical protein